MKRPGNNRRRRGALLIMLLFLLPILLIMLGFSVDLAHMLRVRSQMQSATDLAAKSGAAVLSKAQNLQAARDAIVEVANANEVAGRPLQIETDDIEFGRTGRDADGVWNFDPTGTPINAVRVTSRRVTASDDGAVGLFFGRFYGSPDFQPVSSAVAGFVDVDICLVLDRSSSMKLATDSTADFMNTGSDPRACDAPWADSRWTAVADAVETFVGSMDASLAKEKIAMVSFASTNTDACGNNNNVVDRDQDLTDDTTLLVTALQARSAAVWNGNTDIHAGITEANACLTGASGRPYSEKFMILFTDGAYTGQDPRLAANASESLDIHIFTITFGDGADISDMQDVATITDGFHYHAPDAAALTTVFNDIQSTIEFLVK